TDCSAGLLAISSRICCSLVYDIRYLYFGAKASRSLLKRKDVVQRMLTVLVLVNSAKLYSDS
ncbi:MAG TPA: hypothetical protein VGB84_05290, partial [Arachidicoccus sp.]